MGEIYQVNSLGPLSAPKVCVSEASGEILWPVSSFFSACYGDTQRIFLRALDKSEGPIQDLYTEMIGSDPPPELAVIFSKLIQMFWAAECATCT